MHVFQYKFGSSNESLLVGTVVSNDDDKLNLAHAIVTIDGKLTV